MKLRIIQDHHGKPQPWYRLEEWKANQWVYIQGGSDLELLRDAMKDLINPHPDRFTVIEEHEA
jgi:hypothetical protein